MIYIYFEEFCTLSATDAYIWTTRELLRHYSDVIMGRMASEITSLMSVYPTFHSDDD